MGMWTDQPTHQAWLRDQAQRQWRFGSAMPHPRGGAWYLDGDGRPDPTQPVFTWVSARMTHAYSLGHLAGIPGAGPLAKRAMEGLTGPLRDHTNGGWFTSLGPGPTADTSKDAYAHVFVVFGASSATMAGLDGARELLDDALAVLDEHFWDDSVGMLLDGADETWAQVSDYRGINANMHGVEALLAASDATGDPQWRDRARRIGERLIGWAREHNWRIPEHFDTDWQPMLEHNRDQPNHPFQPYGATVGHALEWARLLLHVEAATGEGPASGSDDPAESSWLEAARELFARGVADGWSVDGEPGFVYTTDWTGEPVVRQRLHWVVAEGIAAAAALHQRTGDEQYAGWYSEFWDYAATYLIRDDGSWCHELSPENAPASSVWSGRPDIYHSLHAVLLPLLPLAPTPPQALVQHADRG